MKVFASFFKKKRLFFFEKKNQKTFIPLLACLPPPQQRQPVADRQHRDVHTLIAMQLLVQRPQRHPQLARAITGLDSAGAMLSGVSVACSRRLRRQKGRRLKIAAGKIPGLEKIGAGAAGPAG